MEPVDTVGALLEIHKSQMAQNEKHYNKMHESQKEQNDTNKQTADALQKLAHQIERSNDRHDVNDSRILDLESYVDYSKPIVDRSGWFQSAFSDFAKKIVLPAIVLAILAAAGYNLIPSAKPDNQKQEQKQ
tara:strand:- start:151 stop:543 length:393 start_codon:yes stop_codon:yes gene_type:complete